MMTSRWLICLLENQNGGKLQKMYCQCQIYHKRRKKECLGKFKFSLN
jgi:hypothetical protein